MPQKTDPRKTDAACPRCGGPSVPIVYGMPSLELFEAADRGEVSLGGCCIVEVVDDDGAVIERPPSRACRGVDCGIVF